MQEYIDTHSKIQILSKQLKIEKQKRKEYLCRNENYHGNDGIKTI